MSLKRLQESINMFRSLSESDAPSPAPMKRGSFYHAIELSPESREQLLKAHPAKYGKTHASHITLNFKPSDEDDKNFPEGQEVPFHITHTAHHEAPGDVGVQAARVAGLPEALHKAKPNMHVTISTAAGSKPAHSNDLLAANAGQPLSEPLKLTGHYRRLKK